MQGTRKGLRVHIGIFGRRNVGKSSLLNAFTRQHVSIVSAEAGTTTDPVEKPMELLPLGPVLFIDTAGVDDEGCLGGLRAARTRQVFDRTDLALIVAEAGRFGQFEEELLAEFAGRRVPCIVVFSKADVRPPDGAVADRLRARNIPVVQTAAPTGQGLLDLRQALLDALPPEMLQTPDLLGDLVGPGDMAVLVVPIDKEAPKGRLIVPQQQAIRNILDNRAMCVVVRETGLAAALRELTHPPQLVVTDSQAFEAVAAVTPPGVRLTSFSILFARLLGDLGGLVQGAAAIDRLHGGDAVLIAEACTHHPIEDDIGRVKIPRWLQKRIGAPLAFHHVQGHDFPHDLSPYRLVIHCGACMFNRRAMLARQRACRGAGVPLTNYGLAIAFCLGILERALEPFPAVLQQYRTGAHG